MFCQSKFVVLKYLNSIEFLVWLNIFPFQITTWLMLRKYSFPRKEEQKHRDDNRAGKELLLNESVVELNTSYTPAQFENSLGKLQCVTVKAPRQIIDVGVVRVAETPRATDSPVSGAREAESPSLLNVTLIEKKKASGEYKMLLMKIEVLFSALLDLEADKLKLEALPTGAPLREQVSGFTP